MQLTERRAGPAGERAVRAELDGTLPAAVTAVHCPEAPRRRTGSTTRCEAELRGGARVRLVVTHAGGDRLTVDLLDAVLDRAELTRRVTRALGDELDRRVAVDCDDAGSGAGGGAADADEGAADGTGRDTGAGGVLVAAPGETLTCTARDGTSRRKVTVEIRDVEGNLEARLG
mgnify:FL=1